MAKILLGLSLLMTAVPLLANAAGDPKKVGHEDGAAHGKVEAAHRVDAACNHKAGDSVFSGGFLTYEESITYNGSTCSSDGARKMAARIDSGDVTSKTANDYLESFKEACQSQFFASTWELSKVAIKKAPCQKGFGTYYGRIGAVGRAKQFCDENSGKKASRPEIIKMADLYCELMILKTMVDVTKVRMNDKEVADFLTEDFRNACKTAFGVQFVKQMNKNCGTSLKKSKHENLNDETDNKKVVKEDAPGAGDSKKDPGKTKAR